ncbi:MAG: hypothetical protein M3Y72_16480 [Acidobacteriota bacterium]|nr:hypothetical protein [Acidobacteriota bacterium]
MQRRSHLLVDFTASVLESVAIESFLDRLMETDSLGFAIEHATILLPPNLKLTLTKGRGNWLFKPTLHPVVEASSALRNAGDSECHLLVLLLPIHVTGDVLGTLLQIFDLDPHFGVSVPRQCQNETGDVFKISDDLGDPRMKTLPRRLLAEVAEFYILPDFLNSCFLVRDIVVTNLLSLDESYGTLNGALQHYLYHCRRAGFRTVVANQAVVPVAFGEARRLIVSRSDTNRLHRQHPDRSRAIGEFTEHPLHVHESLLGRLFSSDNQLRKTLLLDLRGVPRHTNGTAEAALAVCEALRIVRGDWQISILAELATVEHHRLRDRFPEFQVFTREGGIYFTVALRPSQPWRIKTLIELHEMALLNFYAMLDTISWDIMFEVPRGLGATWDFMCQYADGLLYNSEYTRQHMIRRFPLVEMKRDYVFGHSLNPDDYRIHSEDDLSESSDYIFVIGNTYDHKHLTPTVDLLSASFPLQHFKVLGVENHVAPNVESFGSGRLPSAEVDALFAKAKLIVFPSLYEGFGFPIVKGLSYNRTVIARTSELLFEIAAQYRGPGKLIEYSTPADLITAVGRILHGYEVPELSLGSGLQANESPKDWLAVARGVLKFIEGQMSRTSDLQWIKRERAIRQIEAFSV